MEVTCSKGTYIRTLCHDIGRLLGCGGCMEHLTRTRVDRFSIEDSLTLDQLQQLRDQGDRGELHPPGGGGPAVLSGLSRCLPEADSLLHNGNPCFARQLDWSRSDEWQAGAEDGQMFRMYDSNHRFTGVYQYQKDRHWWKPWKMFPM